jgi:Glycosyl transferases group 1/Glycosyltransferase Family 4
MPRVLVVARQGGMNGIETYTRHLAAALAGAGLDVVVADRSEGEAPWPAAATEPLRRRRWRLRAAAGPLESWRTHRDVRAIASRCGADVVHFTYPEFVPRGLAAPAVVTVWHPVQGVARRVRSAAERGEPRLGEGLFALTDRVGIGRAGALVALSPASAGGLPSAAPVAVVPPFLPDAAIAPSGASRGSECAFVSRWLDHPRKGLALAVAAVARARRRRGDLTLTLVGEFADPRAEAGLPPFCRSLGLLAPERVHDVLAGAGCLVLASRWEEFGYVGLESLAAGTPVVCGDLPGFAALAPDGIVRVRSHDEAGFAAAIEDALSRGPVAFPDECRASRASERIVEVYRDLGVPSPQPSA